jgi:DNA-binding CsgD family transcriptional regulator
VWERTAVNTAWTNRPQSAGSVDEQHSCAARGLVITAVVDVAARGTSPASGTSRSTSLILCPMTLLERERELRVLDEALGAAQEGRGGVVLIEAAPGLGKTSLLAAACESAAQAGFSCLRARATLLERDFAYGAVRQLLEPAVARASHAERGRLFAAAAAASRPVVVGDGEAAMRPNPAFAILHGLYWLVNNLTDEGPVVLAVDDAHWADSASLRFVNYLAPRLEGLRLVLVASARSGEDATGDLARLRASPETVVLSPRPLSTGATVSLCRAKLGEGIASEFVTACRETTGGNPFLLEELLREVGDRDLATDARGAAQVRGIGPAVVANSVLLRLTDQPRSATALIRAIAVLGDGAELSEAARLAGLEQGRAARAADLLVSLALLSPTGQLELSHPIVREAVYGAIGPNERAEAHARAIEVLIEGGAASERVAAQIVAAKPAGDSERVALLRRVAAADLARGAPSAAVAWLTRAVSEPPPEAVRAEVLAELGLAEYRLSASGSIDHLAEAVELIHEPVLLARTVRALASALTRSQRADAAVEAIDSAVERTEARDRELALALEAERQAHAQHASLETRARAARRLEGHAQLPGATPGERLVLAGLAFERARAAESASEAAAHLERGLAGGRLLAEQEIAVPGLFYHLVMGLLATDALDLADRCAEQAIAAARGFGSIPDLAYAQACGAWCALRRGAVGQAEEDARTALDVLTAHEISFGADNTRGILVQAALERGGAEAAEEHLPAGGLPRDIRPALFTQTLLEARGLLHVARGGTREGVDDMVELGRRDELLGAANPLASRWRSRAAPALTALGEPERAQALARDDVDRARRWGAASGLGIALRAHALVEGGESLVPRLGEAADVLERSPARLEHARALVDLGAALRRAGSRAEARGILERGGETAWRCGARPLVGRARTELRAAGGPSSDPFGTRVEQLTVSERRVAELAAEGLTNPEIAQALFVTRKTIETHLGHVYRKLGVRGRGRLARALGESASAADA